MKFKNWHLGAIIGAIYAAIFIPLITSVMSSGVELETGLYLLLPGLLGLLLGLFVYQTTTRERSVPYLIIALAFGTTSGVFSVIDGMKLIPGAHAFLLSFSLNCSGLASFTNK
nr:hypothetical protein [Candidatus Sigynarchaeum springense]